MVAAAAAVRAGRWPTTAEDRADAIRQIRAILADSPKERNRLAALRLLAVLEAQNQADEHLERKIDTGHGDVNIRVIFDDTISEFTHGAERR